MANSPRIETADRSRRQLLTGMGGMAVVLGIGHATVSAQAQAPVDDLVPSPADSLLLYLDLVRQSQIQVIASVSDVAFRLNDRLQVAVGDLTTLADDLRKEIATGPLDHDLEAVSQQGRALTKALEASDSSVELVGIHGPAVMDFVKRLEPIQQIQQSATIVLSGKASEILRKLLTSVNTMTDVSRELNDATDHYKRTFTETEAVVGDIRKHLLAAAEAVVAVTSASRQIALGELAVARQGIATLAGMNHASVQAPAITVLGELLDGVQMWIGQVPTMQAEVHAVRYVNAGLVVQSGPTAGLSSRREGLMALLGAQSPPATRVRAMILLALMIPIWTLNKDVDDRRRLTRSALRFLPDYTTRGISDTFVNELATFFG